MAVGIAILKYLLYEKDVIMNRTLVYGALTVLLALAYFGGVTATQALFGAVSGQEKQPQGKVAARVARMIVRAYAARIRVR